MKSVNNREVVWMTYQRALKYMAMAGMILAVGYILCALNKLWLHWPLVSLNVLFTTAYFIFMCFQMILASQRSVPMIVMWTGVAEIALAQMFLLYHWPGGGLLMFYGFGGLITVCAAIIHLIKMPQQDRWSKNALGIWVIVTQVVFVALWYAKKYYWNYMIDDFEPAIPYAFDCVPMFQLRNWNMKVVVMGNGLAMFLPSCYLYVITRIQQKKIKNG